MALWTAACQASLSMGFSRKEYWSGLLCPPPGGLPDPRIRPASLMSPVLPGRFFTTSTTWEAHRYVYTHTHTHTHMYTHTYVYTHTYTPHIFFTHSSIDRHLVCFYVLTIVNNAAINMKFAYLSEILFSYPLSIWPEVEFLDHMVDLFLFLWGTSILFSIVVRPIDISTSSLPRVPILPHPHQSSWLIAIPAGVGWYLIVVLICISLVISDVKYFFMYLVDILMSSLEKYLFRSTHFKIRLLFIC